MMIHLEFGNELYPIDIKFRTRSAELLFWMHSRSRAAVWQAGGRRRFALLIRLWQWQRIWEIGPPPPPANPARKEKGNSQWA